MVRCALLHAPYGKLRHDGLASRESGQWSALKESVRRAGYVSALIFHDRTAIISGFTFPARLKSTPAMSPVMNRVAFGTSVACVLIDAIGTSEITR